jgi:hypothetical protein
MMQMKNLNLKGNFMITDGGGGGNKKYDTNAKSNYFAK